MSWLPVHCFEVPDMICAFRPRTQISFRSDRIMALNDKFTPTSSSASEPSCVRATIFGRRYSIGLPDLAKSHRVTGATRHASYAGAWRSVNRSPLNMIKYGTGINCHGPNIYICIYLERTVIFLCYYSLPSSPIPLGPMYPVRRVVFFLVPRVDFCF